MSRPAARIGRWPIIGVVQIVRLRGVRLGLHIGRHKALLAVSRLIAWNRPLAGCVLLIQALVRPLSAAPAAGRLVVPRLVAALAIVRLCIARLGIARIRATISRSTVRAAGVFVRAILSRAVV